MSPLHLRTRSRKAAGQAAPRLARRRFDGSASRPDAVFAEAGAVGLSGELELLALHRALDLLQVLPDGLYLSCNSRPLE